MYDDWGDMQYLDGAEEQLAPESAPAGSDSGAAQVSFAALALLGVAYTVISDMRGPNVNLGLIKFNLANMGAVWLAWAIVQTLVIWGTDTMVKAGVALPGQATLVKAL